VISGLTIFSLQRGEDEPASGVVEQLALFAFIPLVNGIAGAVGTQTATMMVRGIATGQFEGLRRRRVVLREFAIGWILALVLACLVGGLVSLVGGTESIAPAVALGLAGGILIASLSGTMIPLGCKGIGLDPALVAGPFITSFNDVVAATTYLSIAELVLLRNW
jgi:magnesium transporter